MTEHTELVEGETYIWNRGRGIGGPDVVVKDVGVEYVDIERIEKRGKRTARKDMTVGKAEAQTNFQLA